MPSVQLAVQVELHPPVELHQVPVGLHQVPVELHQVPVEMQLLLEVREVGKLEDGNGDVKMILWQVLVQILWQVLVQIL